MDKKEPLEIEIYYEESKYEDEIAEVKFRIEYKHCYDFASDREELEYKILDYERTQGPIVLRNRVPYVVKKRLLSFDVEDPEEADTKLLTISSSWYKRKYIETYRPLTRSEIPPKIRRLVKKKKSKTIFKKSE